MCVWNLEIFFFPLIIRFPHFFFLFSGWLQITPTPLTVEIPICYSTGAVFVAGLLRFFWFKSLLLGLCVAWWVAGRDVQFVSRKDSIVIGPDESVNITLIYDGVSKMIFLNRFQPQSLWLLFVFSVIRLMEEILHHLIGRLSHYVQGFYIPGGCFGFLNHQQ